MGRRTFLLAVGRAGRINREARLAKGAVACRAATVRTHIAVGAARHAQAIVDKPARVAPSSHAGT